MYQPSYHIADELLNKIAQIEAIRSTVNSSYILPEREIEMRYRATVEATHSSTSIEGNPLNIKQIEKILSDKQPLTRHQYAEVEVKNYKKAIDFIDKRKTTGNKLSAQDILEIHQIITQDLLDGVKTGAWRRNPVYIEDQNGNTVYDGPNAKIVPQAVAELLEWLNSESYNIHPVIAAAILHFQFVSIHPFADGNGRTTRALVTLYLGLRGYDFRSSLVLDSYYSTDRKSYYNALHKVQGANYATAEKAKLNPWLDYFADGFLVSANVLATEVALRANIAKDVPIKQKISRNEADLLSYIQQFGSISLSEAESVLPNISRRTVQRKLRNLVDNGYIQAVGSTSGTVYNARTRRG
jgi:Fic family protein